MSEPEMEELTDDEMVERAFDFLEEETRLDEARWVRRTYDRLRAIEAAAQRLYDRLGHLSGGYEMQDDIEVLGDALESREPTDG